MATVSYSRACPPNMKSSYESRLPLPRAGNSKYARKTRKSHVRRHRVEVTSEGCRSTSSQKDEYVQTAQHVALSSLDKRIQVLMEEDDDCIYHQVPGYQLDDASILSDSSDMNERDLLADASMYMLSGPQDWNNTFGGKYLKKLGILKKSTTPSYETDESDCYVPEERFLCSSENLFSSECYFSPCSDDQNQRQQTWKLKQLGEYTFDHHIRRIPLPSQQVTTRYAATSDDEMLESNTIAETIQPSTSSSRSHIMIPKHDNFEAKILPDVPSELLQMEKAPSSDIESSSNDALVPARSLSPLHKQVEPDKHVVEDLIHGRARNVFADMLTDYIQSAASARAMMIHPPSVFPNFPIERPEESKPPAIHRAASIVLQDILRVNVTASARVSRLQRALKGRKPIRLTPINAVEETDETREDTENMAPEVKSPTPGPFNVSSRTRRHRLMRATRRVKGGEYDKEGLTPKVAESTLSRSIEKAADNSNLGGFWSLRASPRHLRVTKILKSRDYGSAPSMEKTRPLVAGLVLLYIRMKARAMSQNISLNYVYGPPVVYCHPVHRQQIFALQMLLCILREDLVNLFAYQAAKARKKEARKARIEKAMKAKKKLAGVRLPILEKPSLAEQKLHTFTNSTSMSKISDEDTSLEEELDILYSDDAGKLLHPFFKVFIMSAMIETDLARDEYIDAHNSIIIEDWDGEDDGLAEELRKLPLLEADLRREIEKADFGSYNAEPALPFHQILNSSKSDKNIGTDDIRPVIQREASKATHSFPGPYKVAEASSSKDDQVLCSARAPVPLKAKNRELDIDEKSASAQSLKNSPRRVSPKNFDLQDNSNFEAVLDLIVGTSSEEENSMCEAPEETTESTFDASAARRAVQEVLLKMKEQNSLFVPEQHGLKSWLETPGGDNELIISIYPEAALSDLTDADGIVIDYEPCPNIPAKYQEIPSLLSMTSVSTQGTASNDIDEVPAPVQAMVTPQLENVVSINTKSPESEGICCHALARCINPRKQPADEQIATDQSPDRDFLLAKEEQVEGAENIQEITELPRSPVYDQMSETDSVQQMGALAFSESSTSSGAKSLALDLEQVDTRKENIRRRLELQILGNQNEDQKFQGSGSLLAATIGEKVIKALRGGNADENSLHTHVVLEEEPSGSEEGSFYVVRSLGSLNTALETENNIKHEGIQSPTWSLAPLVNNFSDVQVSDLSESGVWSPEPHVSSKASGASTELFKQGQDTKKDSISISTSKRGMSTEFMEMMTAWERESFCQRSFELSSSGDLIGQSNLQSSIRSPDEISGKGGCDPQDKMTRSDTKTAPTAYEDDQAIEPNESRGDSSFSEITVDWTGDSFEVSIDPGLAPIASTYTETDFLDLISIDEGGDYLKEGPMVKQGEQFLDIGETGIEVTFNPTEPEALENDRLDINKPFEKNHGAVKINISHANPGYFRNDSTSTTIKGDKTARKFIHGRPNSPQASQIVKDFALQALRESEPLTQAKNQRRFSHTENLPYSKESEMVLDRIEEGRKQVEAVTNLISLELLHSFDNEEFDDPSVIDILSGQDQLNNLSGLDSPPSQQGGTNRTWASSVLSSISEEDIHTEVQQRLNREQSGINTTAVVSSIRGPRRSIQLDAADDWDMGVEDPTEDFVAGVSSDAMAQENIWDARLPGDSKHEVSKSDVRVTDPILSSRILSPKNQASDQNHGSDMIEFHNSEHHRRCLERHRFPINDDVPQSPSKPSVFVDTSLWSMESLGELFKWSPFSPKNQTASSFPPPRAPQYVQ